MKTHKNRKLQCYSTFMAMVHENSQKSDTSIFFNFHDPGYMKIHKSTWISTKIRCVNFIQFSWFRVHENSQKSDTSIFFNFHDPRYMKIHKNQTLLFSSTFMTPGTWKSTKIRRFYFLQPGLIFVSWKLNKIEASDFCGFSCTGHENWIKSMRLIFVNFHIPGVMKVEQKSDASIFFNFHDPGYMKIHKNQTHWFYSIFMTPGYMKICKNQTLLFYSTFMTPGTWKFTKIRPGATKVEENRRVWFLWIFMFPAGVMKIEENRTIWFLWIFMYPGSWKLNEIEASDFCGFSCTQGSWKLKKIEVSDFFGISCTFVDFHVPGVMKVEKNRSVWFLWILMYPGPWKLNNIEASDFCEFSCTQGHESWIKLKRLIFVNFYVTGVMKVEENQSIWFLWIFKYMGSWKLNKINASDFCEFSCTRGHESWRK